MPRAGKRNGRCRGAAPAWGSGGHFLALRRPALGGGGRGLGGDIGDVGDGAPARLKDSALLLGLQEPGAMGRAGTSRGATTSPAVGQRDAPPLRNPPAGLLGVVAKMAFCAQKGSVLCFCVVLWFSSSRIHICSVREVALHVSIKKFAAQSVEGKVWQYGTILTARQHLNASDDLW